MCPPNPAEVAYTVADYAREICTNIESICMLFYLLSASGALHSPYTNAQFGGPRLCFGGLHFISPTTGDPRVANRVLLTFKTHFIV